MIKLFLCTFLILSACTSEKTARGLSSDQPEAPIVIAEVPVTCMGPKSAHLNVIYLHGIDSPSPSSEELEIRKKLKELSEKLHLRIAIPRATDYCPKRVGKICWGWDDFVDTLPSVGKKVDEAAAACEMPAQNTVILGFSNGGYAAGRLFEKCQSAGYRGVISVSATITEPEMSNDLSECKFIKLMVGIKDSANFDASHAYLKQLKTNGADAEEIDFDGGHELPGKELFDLLKRLKD